MNLITLLLVLIIAFCAIAGYRKGLVKSILKIVLTIATLCVPYFVAPYLGDALIKYTSIDEYFEKIIYDNMLEKAKNTVKEQLANTGNKIDSSYVDIVVNEEFRSEVPKSKQIEIINQFELPEYMKNAIIENNSKEISQKIGANTFYEYISKYVAYIIVKCIALLLLMVGMVMISILLYFTLGAISHLPVISGVNKIAGAFVGLLQGIFISWIVLILANTFFAINQEYEIDDSSNIIIEKLNETNAFENMLDSVIRIEN